MVIRHVEVQLQNPDHLSKKNAPTVIKWKGCDMIRNHSLRAAITEILNTTKSLDVVKVGIVGEPSTGKTSLAKTCAHLIHKMSESLGCVPFAYREFGEEEFYDMKGTLEALDPANYILYFHDLSFLANKKAIEEVKNAVTKIRHLKNGDYKIILIYDYHYTLGLDKYLRQANFRFFTSIGSSEKENMINIVGTRYTSKIEDFEKKYVEMTSKQKCTFAFAAKGFFIYNYKNPFVVCLFFNNSSLRYVIFPVREWIDKICSICSLANKKLYFSEIPVDQFINETNKKFTEYVVRATCKLIMMENGINVYSKPIVTCKKYLYKALDKKEISLEDIATHYGFKITRTKLKKMLDGVLSDDDKTTPIDQLLPTEQLNNDITN
uniref:ORF76 n=1 Tax=Nitrosopumilaceae spindle-shaped virus TaxID=3065433 RepID=A0AAT9JAR2_9VIRU